MIVIEFINNLIKQQINKNILHFLCSILQVEEVGIFLLVAMYKKGDEKNGKRNLNRKLSECRK